MTSSTNPSNQPLPQASAPETQAPDATEQVVPQITEKQAARINAPARNMVISMIVMVLLLLPVIWLMPQPNKNPYRPTVDLPVIAYEASAQAGYPVAAAEQEGWHYNYARWISGQADGIDYWETGQVTPSNKFLEIIQARESNATWIAQKTGNAVPEASVNVGGLQWEVRTLVDPDDKEKITTFYIGEVDGTTLLVKGDAEPSEYQALIEATIAYMRGPQPTAAPTSSTGIK
ncbi:DUF4245 domain-containing protein [Rothia nasimurium]|uniref:DUF4245 domain-containing protein n=1 Tax=Rothia nasimurium TaxID=85336 RepID=UPI001F28175A|nr:DUF4245 domain-containing protein [Rothia nasimurium]